VGVTPATSTCHRVAADCQHLVGRQTVIGGISYFHAYAYDLLAATSASWPPSATRSPRTGGDAGEGHLPVESMVFESPNHWPSAEGDERASATAVLGVQKSSRYFARAGGISSCRTRSCGPSTASHRRVAGARRRRGGLGNVKLAMSHVVPDLCRGPEGAKTPCTSSATAPRCGTPPTARPGQWHLD